MVAKRAFTLIEILMVILVIGIIAVITIPRFIDLRIEATNAKYEGCVAGIRSAIAIYYARTHLPEYEYLCTTANSYRTQNVPSPCYPANCNEINSIVISTGCNLNCSCYDSGTGSVIPCP